MSVPRCIMPWSSCQGTHSWQRLFFLCFLLRATTARINAPFDFAHCSLNWPSKVPKTRSLDHHFSSFNFSLDGVTWMSFQDLGFFSTLIVIVASTNFGILGLESGFVSRLQQGTVQAYDEDSILECHIHLSTHGSASNTSRNFAARKRKCLVRQVPPSLEATWTTRSIHRLYKKTPARSKVKTKGENHSQRKP